MARPLSSYEPSSVGPVRTRQRTAPSANGGSGMSRSFSTTALAGAGAVTDSPLDARKTRSGRLVDTPGRSTRGSPYAAPPQQQAARARASTAGATGKGTTLKGKGKASPRQLEDSMSQEAQEEGQSLFGAFRALPGKALGLLWRSASTSTLPTASIHRGSTTGAITDEESSLEATGAFRSSGLPPPSTQGQQYAPSVASPPRQQQTQPRLPTSKSAHSTLFLAARDPAPRSSGVRQANSRGASPALSSASYDIRRSPSPARERLAGSISTFGLSDHPPPPPLPRLQASQSAYGLTSRSPFAVPPSPSGSLAPSASASRLGSPPPRSPRGSALFPFQAAPRGGSPSLANALPRSATSGSLFGSGQKRTYGDISPPRSVVSSSAFGAGAGRGSPSIVGSARRAGGQGGGANFNFVPSLSSRSLHQRAGSPSLSQAGSRVSLGGGATRYGSPLNPFTAAAAEEPARKKVLVFDQQRGFLSAQALAEAREAEQREGREMPKNEAERILEVLEGLGGSGSGSRGIAVPASVSSASLLPSRLSSSSTSAVISPYARRPAASTQPAARREGVGLESVLRAREERRRLAVQAEREEREREREREESQRRRREHEEEMDEEPEEPRRKTRSMLRVTSPAPAAASTRESPRKKGKGKAVVEESARKRNKRGERTAPEEVLASQQAMDLEPAASTAPTPAPAQQQQQRAPSVPLLSAGPRASSSMRPGRTHSSRTHTASSKVFSAREEDLPPVEEGELGKIKLGGMLRFPEGFTLGGSEGAAAAGAAEAGSSLLDRLTPAAPNDQGKPEKKLLSFPAPAFTAPPAPTAATGGFLTVPSAAQPARSLSPPPPSFSFSPSPELSREKDKTPPAAAPPAGNLFAFSSQLLKPSAAPVEVKQADKDKGAVPSFFSGLGASAKEPEKTVLSPFAVAAGAGSKEKEQEKKEQAGANPFAGFGFGKPAVANGDEATTSKPAPAFSFGGVSTNPFGTSSAAASSTSDKPAPAAAASPFSFSLAPPSSSSSPKTDAPAVFGSSSNSLTSASLAKQNGLTVGGAPGGGPGSLAGSLATEEQDEDSGMEDDSGPIPPAAAAAEPAEAKAFSFGNGTGNGVNGGSTFGAPAAASAGENKAPSSSSSSFTFGSPSKPAAPAFSFGAPSSTAAASPEKPAAASRTPSFTFGAPAPPSEAASAPGSRASTPFSFGAPTSSAAPAFGGAPMTNSTSAPGFGSPAAATTTSTGFSFGAPAAAAPAAPAGGGFSFTFGGGAANGAPAPAAAAPASPFSFGGGASGGSGASPFAFGSQPSTPSATAAGANGASNPFAFGSPAAAAAPGSPAGAGASLFNIGSGGGEETPRRKIAGMRKRRGG